MGTFLLIILGIPAVLLLLCGIAYAAVTILSIPIMAVDKAGGTPRQGFNAMCICGLIVVFALMAVFA